PPSPPTLFPYTTLFRSTSLIASAAARAETSISDLLDDAMPTLSGSYLAALSATNSQDYDSAVVFFEEALSQDPENLILLDRTFVDRKSTRLNSSHVKIS